MELGFKLQQRLHRGEITYKQAVALATGVAVEDESFEMVCIEIGESDDVLMKQLLESHNRCIESRTDYTNCHKNLARARLIKQWKRAKKMVAVGTTSQVL